MTPILFLGDGGHAQANCDEIPGGSSRCSIEAFEAEKRVTVPCSLLKPEEVKASHVTFYKSEFYQSIRKGNDISLWTGGGWVFYHIIGPW